MRTDKLVLLTAFALAVALHAAVLPWVGAAVDRAEVTRSGDLTIVDLDAPALINAGEKIDAIVTVRYEAVEASTVHQAYRLDLFSLSRDRTDDNGDPRVGHHGRSVNFTDGQTDQYRTPIEIPADADGPYWLLGLADYERRIPDRDRANNIYAKRVFIDGPQTPELAVDMFDAPDRATPGGSIRVNINIQNTGEGWAFSGSPLSTHTNQPHWTDRVYLSANDTLDATDVELRGFDRHAPLGPGDGYGHEQVELPIPRGVTGPMYLILTADAEQVLDQPSFTAGLAVRKIELVDTGAPDLVVAMLEQPDRLVINRPTTVAFSIANLGGVATDNANWADGFYLSRTPELDASAVPIAQTQAEQPLESRARYTSQVDLTLPDSVEPGQWYLIAKADADDAIDERGFDGNNTLAVPVMVLTEKQADAEIQLGALDRPERMVVQWIEHDRVEDHRARLSRTVQPALQDRADPVPDAPLVFDPKPPSVAQQNRQPAGDPTNPQRTVDPTDQQDARPKPNAPDASQTDVAPRPQTPGSLPPKRIDGVPGDEGERNPDRPGIDDPNAPNTPRPIDPTPGTDNTSTPEPGDRDVGSPADPSAPDTDRTTDSKTPSETESDTDASNPDDTDATTPSEQTQDTDSQDQSDNPDADDPSKEDGEGDNDTPQQDESTTNKPTQDESTKPDGKEADPATPSEPQNPTSAPRDPSEAPPVTTEVAVKLQPGKVLVGEGIKVTPKMPTPPGTGARAFTIPRNGRVRVTFTSDGKVYEAKVIKSTLSQEWDAAIEASLYRWTAEGDAVKDAKPYVAIEWNYILNDLMDDE
jgi:hypothetical protein